MDIKAAKVLDFWDGRDAQKDVSTSTVRKMHNSQRSDRWDQQIRVQAEFLTEIIYFKACAKMKADKPIFFAFAFLVSRRWDSTARSLLGKKN